MEKKEERRTGFSGLTEGREPSKVEMVPVTAVDQEISARAGLGDREKFEAAMAKVADVEPPDEQDRF